LAFLICGPVPLRNSETQTGRRIPSSALKTDIIVFARGLTALPDQHAEAVPLIRKYELDIEFVFEALPYAPDYVSPAPVDHFTVTSIFDHRDRLGGDAHQHRQARLVDSEQSARCADHGGRRKFKASAGHGFEPQKLY
jgi:hypothetical protein